ncbi:hypothetical protein V8B97DRAFT_1632905 [Scleroderma yunnanense]
MDMPLTIDRMLAMPSSPVEYVRPVIALDGSTGYDRPLDNYFDFAKVNGILPTGQSFKLYDTVANAHDTHFQLVPGMFSANSTIDWSKCPSYVGRERLRQVALLHGDSPDYLGLRWETSGWRPRRTSFEDRRGVVPVTLAEVNSLPPPVEPEDTSIPSLTSDWFEEIPGRITDSELPADVQEHTSDAGDELEWGYATDSTVDTAVSVLPSAQRRSIFTCHSDSEDTSFDTDTDVESDDYYDWNNPHISAASPSALSNVPKWVIPRKRPSFIIAGDGYGCANNGHVSCLDESTSSESCTRRVGSVSGDVPHNQGTKRKPMKLAASRRPAKKAKNTEDDASVTVREGSVDPRPHLGIPISDTPRDASVPPTDSTPDPVFRALSTAPSVSKESLPAVSQEASPIWAQKIRPRPSKQASSQTKQTFPCLLDGCTHVCYSTGDLMRHQQSLRHRTPEFICLGCQHAFTRPDALKRHFNSKPKCKGMHKAAVLDSKVRVELP